MIFSVFIAALLGFVVGWLALDSLVSGLILGTALGAVMYFYDRRKRGDSRERGR